MAILENLFAEGPILKTFVPSNIRYSLLKKSFMNSSEPAAITYYINYVNPEVTEAITLCKH